MINKGDTMDLVLDYQFDGRDITEGQFDEIEFQIDSQKSPKGKKFLLSLGQIYWDENEACYCVRLGQADTFDLPYRFKYQARFLSGEDVYSSDIRYAMLGDTLSTKILGG